MVWAGLGVGIGVRLSNLGAKEQLRGVIGMAHTHRFPNMLELLPQR